MLLAVAQSRSLPGARVFCIESRDESPDESHDGSLDESHDEMRWKDAPAGLKSFRQEGEKRKRKRKEKRECAT